MGDVTFGDILFILLISGLIYALLALKNRFQKDKSAEERPNGNEKSQEVVASGENDQSPGADQNR